MPAVSSAQLRAMYAAKAGHSTLGIPKSVGAEFVAATPKGAKLPKRKKRRVGGKPDRSASARIAAMLGGK